MSIYARVYFCSPLLRLPLGSLGAQVGSPEWEAATQAPYTLSAGKQAALNDEKQETADTFPHVLLWCTVIPSEMHSKSYKT